MCATNIWAVDAHAFGPAFRGFAADRLGVEPQPTELRIASGRVRPSAVAFTLTRRMCDCDALIGARAAGPVDGEITAETWLAWLSDLPEHVPHLTRLAVLHAWSPQDDAVVPARARGIRIADVSEDVLRDVRDDMLLTIDYA